ncbi:MAG: hypothetical protein KDJ29_00580 [Hyphomicrobiales bacterium]|nr:hypothetical protein [Hyphomicrobiales bacterium]
MTSGRKTPRDLAQSLARRGAQARSERRPGSPIVRNDGMWKRETFTLPRTEARAKAREWFGKFPKAAYMTEIEFWRELSGGEIEFTIRRLPSAD